MIKNYTWVVALATLIFASCSKEEGLESVPAEQQKVEISAQIESIDANSRAEIGVDGKGHFVDNDQISLLYQTNSSYDVYRQVLTLKGGEWTPSISWNDQPEMTFSGFYPVVSSTDKVFKHSVELNQSTKENFEKSDLLYADPVTVQKGNKVNLSFRHLLSCLTVVVEGDLTLEEIEKAKVVVKGYSAIDVNQDGTLGKLYDHSNGVANVSEITMRYQGNKTFQAILCPQNTNLDYGTWWIKFDFGNGKAYQMKEPKFKKLEPGKNTTVRYTFKTSDPNYANKTVWVYGLNGDFIPHISDTNAWYSLSNTLQKGFNWNKDQNWYDCDKKDASTNAYDDHRLCWAATSSNMIHWWLDRNSDILKDYCTKNSIPHLYKNHKESDIFQVYKDAFTDEGSFIDDGLNWYFLKEYSKRGEASLVDANLGGYFMEALSSVGSMAVEYGIADIYQLDKILKMAFENQQAIGLTVLMPSWSGAHALTIWGARFDEKGRVCEIYYTDNNDGFDPPHLIASAVKQVNYRARLQGAVAAESYTMEIQALTLLSLKSEELSQYFASHPQK